MTSTGLATSSAMFSRPCQLHQNAAVSARTRQRRWRAATSGFHSHAATPELQARNSPTPASNLTSLQEDILATEHLFTLGSAGAVQSALSAAGSLLSEVDDSGTSAVCSQLPLASFLGQALQVAMEEPPAPSTPLLIITTLARLHFGSPEAAEPYRVLYQQAAGMLMEIADSAGVYGLANSSVLSAQDVLEYFSATANMSWAATVYKGSGFGHLLTHHLHQNHFSPQELLVLLESWATLRARSGYNPCVINFRHLGQSLVAAAPGYTPEELLCVVAACRQFEWPVYASNTLLEGVCEITLARAACGELPASACEQILDTAIQVAAHHRPTLADALRARLATRLAAQLAPRRLAPRTRWAAQSPANNAVLGPERRAGTSAGGGLLLGLTTALPAAVLLPVVLAVPLLPSQWQALASALALASLAAAVNLDA